MIRKIIKRSIYSISILLLLIVVSLIYGKEFYVGELNAGTLSIGDTAIVVERVDTPPARTRGLSGREELPEGTGMLFVFPPDDRHGFWMKDMNFPIDIIWINKSFRVVDLKESVFPESFPEIYTPKSEARYALEVNSGFAKRHGVREGTLVQFVDHSLKRDTGQ